MKILVVTNPAYDVTTRFLSVWIKDIVDASKRLAGIELIEMEGDDVTKENFTKLVRQKEPRLIFFNGHGNHDFIAGHGDEILVRVDENHEILEGKIIHALSCQSGKTLGPKSIEIGTLSYLGYKEDYKFYHLGHPRGSDGKDVIAALFLDPAFEVLKSLMNGLATKDAYRRSQKLYADNLRRALTSDKTLLNTHVASMLYHNLDNQVVLGDLDATL